LPRPQLLGWSARRQILLETQLALLKEIRKPPPSDIKHEDAITAIWAASEVLPPPRDPVTSFLILNVRLLAAPRSFVRLR